MDKVNTSGVGIYAQHYPRVAAVITSQTGDKTNAMTAAWHTPVSFNPPLYAVSLSSKRFSYKVIAESREFGVNFLPAGMAEAVAAVGAVDGAEVDKLRAFHLAQDRPAKTQVPILRGAYAAYECKLVDDRLYGDHRLLVGEIVAVHWAEGAFMEDGSLDLARVSPVLYFGNEHYVSTDTATIRTIEREFCIDCLAQQEGK